MKTEYRYILDKSSKKHPCPSCGKRRFVRYIDTETNNYLPDQYGRCDRENNCPHHINPYTDGYAKAIWQQENGQYNNDWIPKRPTQKTPASEPKIYPIPYEVLQSTQSRYERNIFIQNLLAKVPFPFELKDVEKVISLYQLGTAPDSRAVCFPFIDNNNRIRAIQEKIFDGNNHTDNSKKYNPTWIHSRLKATTYRNKSLPKWLSDYTDEKKNETKVSCLFGEQLLRKYPRNPVALVEAPKTAIYGALYFGFPDQPQNLLWLAVGGLSYLNHYRCKALKGRDVFLFPDLSTNGTAYKKWSDKAESIQRRLRNTCFKVSDLLERLAPDQDKEHGNDLADYLIKQDWREFREQSMPRHITSEPSPNITTNDTDAKTAILTSNDKYQPDHPPIEAEPSIIPFSKQNKSPQQRPIKAESNPIGRTIEAYTNHQNELLIQNPMDANRFTMYPDFDSYNYRSVIPGSRDKDNVNMTELTPVEIHPTELMVVLPVREYPQDELKHPEKHCFN